MSASKDVGKLYVFSSPGWVLFRSSGAQLATKKSLTASLQAVARLVQSCATVGRAISIQGQRHMRLKNLIPFIGLVVLALVAPSSAGASSIKIWDGVHAAVIISDGSGLDDDASAGVIEVNSYTYWAWKISIDGYTKPSDGSATDPYLYLHDISTSTTSAASTTLTIWFSEVGFGPSGTYVFADIGGKTAGSMTYETYKGSGLFDEGTLLTSQSFNTSSFNGADIGDATGVAGPYSLTQKFTITHGAGTGKKTSFDAVLTVPDQGTTLSLLGLALLGLAGVNRLTRASRT